MAGSLIVARSADADGHQCTISVEYDDSMVAQSLRVDNQRPDGTAYAQVWKADAGGNKVGNGTGLLTVPPNTLQSVSLPNGVNKITLAPGAKAGQFVGISYETSFAG